MLKKIIIISAVVLLPIAFYFAAMYGTVDKTTFAGAVKMSSESVSEDQAKKVEVDVVIVSAKTASDKLLCTDSDDAQFYVDFTGSEPHSPFKDGQKVRFVGHVHGGETPYFHASQVFSE
ncbi:MAG: hypothetical protein HQ472_03250 [Ignavibacteria bacterium]|nr:hypothetical protein [Ignavibacteria bacterium]